jgi:hypothetical protein
MGRKKQRNGLAPSTTSTPSRRSARFQSQQDSTVQTPGQRFRSLVGACSDFVPVAAVANSDSPVDDVVVSPLPKKQTRQINLVGSNLNTECFTETINIANFPVPAFASAATSRFSSAQNANDEEEEGCGDDDNDPKIDDRKMPARSDNLPSIAKDEYDNNDDDGAIDAFLGTDDNSNKVGVNDIGDDKLGIDDREEHNFDAFHVHDEGGQEVTVAVSSREVETKEDNLDPTSLFLHNKEDADALMAFFADDSNYDDEGQREQEVKINNE